MKKSRASSRHLRRLGLVHLLATVLLSLPFFSNAQLTQPSRFELETRRNAETFTVVSRGEKGLAMIHQKDKYQTGSNFWELILLDSALQQTWITEIELSNQMHLIGYEALANNVYFLFRLGTIDTGRLHLICINCTNHTIAELDIEPQLDFKLSYFSIIGNSALLGGYVTRQPAVFLYDMGTHRSKVVPGFFAKNTDLLDLRTNQNNTFNTLVTDRNTSEKKLLTVRTFDEDGSLLVEESIEIDADKAILTGLTSTLQREDLLVVGTWGHRSGKLALGIFTVKVDPLDKQAIHYYDFAEFNHFLDYMSEKKAAKIKAKASKRRNAGKLPSLGIHVNPARLVENAEGFMLLSEMYSPMTSNASNSSWNFYNPNGNPYGGYGGYPYGFNNYGNRYSPYPYGNFAHRTDVNMKFASIAVFDGHGKLIVDTGMPIDDVKLPTLDQLSDFVVSNGKIFQLYKNEKHFQVSTTQRDGVTTTRSEEKIQLKSPDDILKSDINEDSALRYWYGPYLVAWGFEYVKGIRDNRHVFYINKLRVE